MSKVVIVGAGMVGSTAAYTLMIDSAADEIALVDVCKERAEGHAMDMSHGIEFVPEVKVSSCDDYSVCKGADIIVICAGGGGIPTVCREDGTLVGVEAVIDKDLASSLLAQQIQADLLLMLTDVDAVYQNWGEVNARAFKRISPQAIKAFSFAAGSMAPKVQAAFEFVEKSGSDACIGTLNDAMAIINGEAGTLISNKVAETEWWD